MGKGSFVSNVGGQVALYLNTRTPGTWKGLCVAWGAEDQQSSKLLCNPGPWVTCCSRSLSLPTPNLSTAELGGLGVRGQPEAHLSALKKQ